MVHPAWGRKYILISLSGAQQVPRVLSHGHDGAFR